MLHTKDPHEDPAAEKFFPQCRFLHRMTGERILSIYFLCLPNYEIPSKFFFRGSKVSRGILARGRAHRSQFCQLHLLFAKTSTRARLRISFFREKGTPRCPFSCLRLLSLICINLFLAASVTSGFRPSSADLPTKANLRSIKGALLPDNLFSRLLMDPRFCSLSRQGAVSRKMVGRRKRSFTSRPTENYSYAYLLYWYHRYPLTASPNTYSVFTVH